MKKILLFICSFLFLITTVQAEEKSSVEFVKNLTDEVITNVLKSNDTQEQKTERFEKYFLKALDTQNIGKFVLGRYVRSTTKEDQKAFIQAFTNMALKSWADKFNLYTGQELQFQGERPAEGKNQVYVDSLILNEPNPVQVIWRLREKNGEYKIVDIIVEGVSMALSYRNEYTAFLQTHTLPELTEQLQKQADSFTPTKK